MIRRYVSTRTFYAADQRRVRSVEVDFGVHWRSAHASWPTWRCSWVEDTGELVVIRLVTQPLLSEGGPVHVIATGVFDIEDVEELLRGWPDMCGQRGSLEWLRERCATLTTALAREG